MMLTRWDSDSPPPHSHSSSNSPTIIINDSSDSEEELNLNKNVPCLNFEQTKEPMNVISHLGDTENTPSQEAEEATIVVGQSETAQPSTLASTDSDNFQLTGPRQNLPKNCDQTVKGTTSRAIFPSSTLPLCSNERSGLSAPLKSTREVASGRLESVDSCPEVSSSSSSSFMAAVNKITTPVNDEVSSTSGSGDPSKPTTLPPGSAVVSQPLSELRREAASLDQHCVTGETATNDDDDFEISLYAEDGNGSLGGEGTPTSVILKSHQSRKLRSKSTKVHKLKREGHHKHKESHTHQRKGGKTRIHEHGSSGSHRERERRKRRQSLEKDEERRYHRHSRRRSRSQSHSRSRQHRYDPATGKERSRSRRRLREKRRLRSGSKLSHSSYSSSDNETSSGMRRSVIAKVERTHEKKEDRDQKERTSYIEQSKGRKRQRRSESRSPHRLFSTHHRGEHDYERRSPPHKRKDRFKLYSDDSWGEPQNASHVQSASGKRSSSRRQTKTNSESVLSPRDRSEELSFSDEDKQECGVSDETKQLAQELGEVDKQIQDNKKELLKSMLRKERLELLQKNLHNEGHPASEGLFASSVLQSQTSAVVRTTSEMEMELETLNRAIVDGKRQLLRVMKKAEEEQLEMD